MPFLSSAFSQPRATSWPRLFSIAQKEPLSDLRAGQAPLTLAARAGRAEHRGSLQLAHLRHHREPFLFACTSLCLRTGMSAPVRALGAQSNQSEVPEAALTSLGKSVGVVVVDHGSRRAESNANLDEFVRVFQKETGYTIVEPAHMELARPTIAEAFTACVERGADFIIVSPYFLAPGRHWSQDIPSICSEAAAAHPGLRYMLAAPIGAHPLVARILQDRISHCLKRVSGSQEPCSACGASDALGCRILESASGTNILDSSSGTQAVSHLNSL